MPIINEIQKYVVGGLLVLAIFWAFGIARVNKQIDEIKLQVELSVQNIEEVVQFINTQIEINQ